MSEINNGIKCDIEWMSNISTNGGDPVKGNEGSAAATNNCSFLTNRIFEPSPTEVAQQI
jgi:hypothetical protein